jgi:CheY-like chemotaxis protein
MLQEELQETAQEQAALEDASRILLVGTDHAFLDTMALAFAEAGLQARAFATVVEAQRACREWPADLIVVDWVLGGLFADEILSFLEVAFRPRPLPPVLVISRMSRTDTQDCLPPHRPIQGILTRPVARQASAAWAARFAACLKTGETWRCASPLAEHAATLSAWSA